MAEGIVSLRKTQIGPESTAGTAVAATSIQRVMSNGAKNDSPVEFINEHIGYLPQTNRTVMPKLAASIAFEDSPLTFEQAMYPFDAGIQTVAATQDGAGTDFIWAYLFPTTTPNTIKTYTIEHGDNIQAREMEYSFCESFTITFNAGEVVNISSNWIGRQWTNASFTSLNAPTVEEILTSKGKLYIDAATAAAGTTQVTNTLLSGTLNVKTGWKAVWTADGNLYFSFAKNTMPEITLDLTYEHNSSAETEYAAFVAQTPRQIQLKFEGSAAASAGTTYTYKTLIINLCGTYETWDAFGDQDGNNTVSCSFRAAFESTAGAFAGITVVNEVSAI